MTGGTLARGASGGAPWANFEAHSFGMLEIGHDLEEVAGLRVTAWSEQMRNTSTADQR